MTWVDPSQRAVEATDAEQATRPKLSVLRVDNGDGTYSYYQQVALQSAVTIDAAVDVTVGGEELQTDTVEDATILVAKLRMGVEGQDGGLVDDENPMATKNDPLLEATLRNGELLEAILDALTATGVA